MWTGPCSRGQNAVVSGGTVPWRLERIVSGGQTGVDRGALDAAITHGVPHGGFCPAARLAEDGAIPARYAVTENRSADYAVRTEQNVLAADGTLVLCVGAPTKGTALTCRLAERHGRPLLVVDLACTTVEEPARVAHWVAAHGIRVLNVAGPRESAHPGIQEAAAALVGRVLDSLRPGGAMQAEVSAPGVAAAARLIADAHDLVVLSGAGISTESGIPDFRSPGGIWSRYDPRDLTFQRFCASADVRRRYWEMGAELYPLLRDAEPNRAHRVLAAIERRGGLRRIVTQNIDGLHQRAGSSPEKVIEIHGTALAVACLGCGERSERDRVQARFAAGETDLRCACGGLLKPATISFGQPMPEHETEQAFADAAAADVFLVVGSSLVVFPAANLPAVALENGARLVIVNREPTPYDPHADVTLQWSAGEALGAIGRELGLRLE